MPDIADVAWSERDDLNSESVPGGWPQGTMPAYVDQVGRMMMGATKRFWNKINPIYQTSGTGDNYIVQTEVGVDQINLYELICARIDRSNATSTPTLQFGATNQRTIVKAGPSGYIGLAAGDLFAGNSHTFWYNGAFYILVDPAIVIGGNVQPYSPNLTSWAAITRASGYDTFAATPSSANLRALVSDESGTGALLFQNGALGTPASGAATNLTGTAAGLTAGNVTTNANLTGPITSVGNTTSIASQTGTGSKFVVDTSPTLVTPNIGAATATSINKVAITQPATGATITIPDGVTLTGPAASGTAMTLGNVETVTGAKTFSTQITTPKAIGGTAVGSSLSLQSTSGVGSSDFINFLVGNAGATEAARFDTAGRFVIGNTSSIATIAGLQSSLQVHMTRPETSSFFTWSNAAAGPIFAYNKSRGATIGTRAVVQSGDTLGIMLAAGDDGTNFIEGAEVRVVVDAAPATNSMPSRLQLSTTTTGATTPTERVRIDSNGFANVLGGSFGRAAPVTKTTSFTLATTENWIICNGAASITATLPSAASFSGREVTIRTIAAFTVVSASSNVIPIAGGAAGTAILAATAGKFATLVSDGTNWQIMASN